MRVKYVYEKNHSKEIIAVEIEGIMKQFTGKIPVKCLWSLLGSKLLKFTSFQIKMT